MRKEAKPPISTTLLHQLAADKVGPAADLGGDALLAREFLAHALREEKGGLDEVIST